MIISLLVPLTIFRQVNVLFYSRKSFCEHSPCHSDVIVWCLLLPVKSLFAFQFVNFTEIMSKNVDRTRKEAEFALSALMEIPSQYKATLELNILGQLLKVSSTIVAVIVLLYNFSVTCLRLLEQCQQGEWHRQGSPPPSSLWCTFSWHAENFKKQQFSSKRTILWT